MSPYQTFIFRKEHPFAFEGKELPRPDRLLYNGRLITLLGDERQELARGI